MNQELNASTELSTIAVVAVELNVATLVAPMILDQDLLAQIAGGVSPNGPYGGW